MKRKLSIITIAMISGLAAGGCSTFRTIFASGPKDDLASKPIHNPFGDYYANAKNEPGNTGGMVLRTRKGDRSVEVELPKETAEGTDFTIPISPAFRDTGGRSLASSGGAIGVEGGDAPIDDSYKSRPPTAADREITSKFPQTLAQDENQRHEVEQGMGLRPTEDSVPDHDTSYLASLDHVKQLYRAGRYETALIEVDDLIHQYQTDAKLYEMRGTLLDRVGQTDLAIKSWRQALRFEPSNVSLKRFVERREQKRSLASP